LGPKGPGLTECSNIKHWTSRVVKNFEKINNSCTNKASISDFQIAKKGPEMANKSNNTNNSENGTMFP